MSDTIKYTGQLEIDTERGVLYFHSAQTGITVLRICGLNPQRLQEIAGTTLGQIDITLAAKNKYHTMYNAG